MDSLEKKNTNTKVNYSSFELLLSSTTPVFLSFTDDDNREECVESRFINYFSRLF